MSNKEEVEREILEYLEKADNLHYNDRLRYLKALFDKHFLFTKLDHVMTYHNFHDIVSDAKSRYVNLITPMQISGRNIAGSDLAHVALIEAVIMSLNGAGLLKKLVILDYTRDRK